MPWLTITVMVLPFLYKKNRKAKSEVRKAQAPGFPVYKEVVPMSVVEEPHLPDEGVSVTKEAARLVHHDEAQPEIEPLSELSDRPHIKQGVSRNELRRALILSEIFNRKQY